MVEVLLVLHWNLFQPLLFQLSSSEEGLVEVAYSLGSDRGT